MKIKNIVVIILCITIAHSCLAIENQKLNKLSKKEVIIRTLKEKVALGFGIAGVIFFGIYTKKMRSLRQEMRQTERRAELQGNVRHAVDVLIAQDEQNRIANEALFQVALEGAERLFNDLDEDDQFDYQDQFNTCNRRNREIINQTVANRTEINRRIEVRDRLETALQDFRNQSDNIANQRTELLGYARQLNQRLDHLRLADLRIGNNL